MAPLRFTFAISSYDHIQAVVDGRIPIEGAEPLFMRLPIPEAFRRFVITRDWDVSEMGFVQYATIRAGGDNSIVGIPVFTSRLHRHTAIFVRSDRIRKPEDLRGSRIGIAAWANSAAVWARGMLSDMHGIQPAEITWYQGGVERPGRPEAVRPKYLGSDVRMIRVVDRGIEEMLWTGDLDGMIVPSPPASIEASVSSGGLVRRLYEDQREPERLYRKKTGCVPIMHMIAIDRALFDRDPAIATRIYDAMETSRREYFARLADTSASRIPVPWIDEHIESLQAVIGRDVWPYGVEANLASIETGLRYLREQGLIAGNRKANDVFPEWQAIKR